MLRMPLSFFKYDRGCGDTLENNNKASSVTKLQHKLTPKQAAAALATDRQRIFNKKTNNYFYQPIHQQQPIARSPRYSTNRASRLRRTIHSRRNSGDDSPLIFPSIHSDPDLNISNDRQNRHNPPCDDCPCPSCNSCQGQDGSRSQEKSSFLPRILQSTRKNQICSIRDCNSDTSTNTNVPSLPPIQLQNRKYLRNFEDHRSDTSFLQGTSCSASAQRFVPKSKWDSYYKIRPTLVRKKTPEFEDIDFCPPPTATTADLNFEFEKNEHENQNQKNSRALGPSRSCRHNSCNCGCGCERSGVRMRKRVLTEDDRNPGIGATALSTIVPRKNYSRCRSFEKEENSSQNQSQNQNLNSFQNPDSRRQENWSDSNFNSHSLNLPPLNIRACKSSTSATAIVKRNLHESVPHLLSPSLQIIPGCEVSAPQSPKNNYDYELLCIENKPQKLNPSSNCIITCDNQPSTYKQSTMNNGKAENDCFQQLTKKLSRVPSEQRVCDAFILRRLFELELRERERQRLRQRQQSSVQLQLPSGEASNFQNITNNTNYCGNELALVDKRRSLLPLVGAGGIDCYNNRNESQELDEGGDHCDWCDDPDDSVVPSQHSRSYYDDGDDDHDAIIPNKSTCFNGPVIYIDRGKKDFILENAIKSARMPAKVFQPRVIDDWRGNSSLIPSTRMVYKKDYGRIPAYLKRRKEELQLELEAKAFSMDVDFEGATCDQCILLSDLERKALIDGLGLKWDELFKEFQSFPMFSSSQRIIRRKSQIEDELRNLEEDLRLFSRHGKLFVSNQSSNSSTLPASSSILQTEFLWK